MIGRAIGRCAQCGAQYPLEQGHLSIGSLPDKVAGNSFTGICCTVFYFLAVLAYNNRVIY